MGDPEPAGGDDRPDEAGIPAFRPLTAEGSLEDLKAGRVAMSLNEPQLGGEAAVVGPLSVRGWAHARGGINAVLVVVDGKRYEALRPIVRTDLLEYYGADAAREAGFSLQLHPSECPPGTHAIAVIAVGREGDAVGVEGEIACHADPLDSETPPDPVAAVDWIEQRTVPRQNVAERETAQPVKTPTTPEAVRRLYDLALMWESRALLAEADAAASRIEAELASTQQEVAIRMLREAEARLRELEVEREADGPSAERPTPP